MTELIGKDFIYSRVLLRCVHVCSLCTDNVLELEQGVPELIGRISYTSGFSYTVYLLVHCVTEHGVELEAGCG